MLRPIPDGVGKLEGVSFPSKMRKRDVSFFEKLCESGVRRKERQSTQSFSHRLIFVVLRSRTEFAQQFEVVQQYLVVTSAQNLFDSLPADFGRYDRWVG